MKSTSHFVGVPHGNPPDPEKPHRRPWPQRLRLQAARPPGPKEPAAAGGSWRSPRDFPGTSGENLGETREFSWFRMVDHGLYSYDFRSYRNLSWFISYTLSWCIMLCTLQFMMVHDALVSWCIMAHNGFEFTIYHGVSWCIMVYHGL